MLALAIGCGGESTGTGGPDAAAEGNTADSSSGGSADHAAADAGTNSNDGAVASCPPTDAGAGASGLSGRVPLHHQPAGAVCSPSSVGVSPDASTCAAPDGGACGACSSDSDYTASNCRTDDDCGPDGYCSPSVLEGCVCLSTALCGDAGGGCYAGTSGSVVGLPPGPGWVSVPCSCGDACGHGYFCHTRCDTCVDDSDCTGQGTCNYDSLNHLWSCSECWPIP